MKDEAKRLLTIAVDVDARSKKDHRLCAEAVVRDYIGHGELGLALEMFVDLLNEHDVALFKSEYAELRALHIQLGSERVNALNFLRLLS